MLIAGCGGGGSDGHASAGMRRASAPYAGVTSRPSAPQNVVNVPDTWSQGLARFGVRDPDNPNGILYGYMDESGKVVIKPQYHWAGDFHDGMATVQPVKEGPWGYIDTLGRLFIPAQFISIRDFSEGKAAVSKRDNLWGYIDTTGKMVIQPQYYTAAPFSDGLARVTLPGVKDTIYINHHGKEVLRLKGKDISGDFNQGLAAALKDGKWGFIDKQGKWKIPAQYKFAAYFHNDYVVVYISNAPFKVGMIDRKGHTAIEPVYTGMAGPDEGLVLVSKGDEQTGYKVGFIDMQNHVVSVPQYNNASPFAEGYAAVCVGENDSNRSKVPNNWGYIDHKGALVIPLQFATAGQFHNGRATVTTHDGQWGWIDTRGKWAWGPFPMGK